VVSRIEAMLRRVVGAQLELHVELEPALARVHADPGQLEQVLMNLAINARDAMPDGGHLTIGTANADLREGVAGVELRVRDTGIGMDAATRARIFEPFFTTKDVGKGTGLGLAMVYGIVQQSGGTIAVESAPGAGSTFRIVLPAVGALDDQVLGILDEPGAARGTETVLVVEDEPQVRAFAERVLAAHGYRVLAAAEGAEALALLDAEPQSVALLLTDVVMPRMTGREVARRARLRCPDVRVVFMSGHSEDAIASHGVLAEDAAFVRKPFSPEQLLRVVRETLDREAADVAR
jgi:CheY-like chemotaxis protein